MKFREDLSNGEKKIEAFLTDLAVRGNVSASTQNQAMNSEISDAVNSENQVLINYRSCLDDRL